jgi:pyruvate dehydrogenase E2 component (dihydrolipoamide acetyltransferase)
VIARALTPSAAIPQFTVWREVALDEADAVRQGVSWTTVLLQAYAASLRAVPELLGRWEGDGIVQTGGPVVALAVATDRGKQGRIEPKYLAPANASLSNLGGLGVDRFQALLTPPQASVLSLGSVRNRPVAVPGGLGVALTVEAGLTVDHRVADGAEAATLLDHLAQRLSGTLT